MGTMVSPGYLNTPTTKKDLRQKAIDSTTNKGGLKVLRTTENARKASRKNFHASETLTPSKVRGSKYIMRNARINTGKDLMRSCIFTPLGRTRLKR